jgi:flagellar biosynthesis/type III secretory pathway chaperone
MELDQEPKKIERNIYENAIQRMETMGTKAILHPRLIEKRDAIRTSLLDYYESTEEYEKCKYINEYFNELEKEIGLMEIVGAITKEK